MSDRSSLRGRQVLVAVCGSIAAYKAAEVVRGLIDGGAGVRVVMTEAATRFVGPATFAALSEHPVHTDLFSEPERVVHVELGRWAETYVVVGATASTLERLAGGAATDVPSACYLMCRCPVVCAPAMHTEMWEHPAVRRNVARLAADGVRFVGPEEGPLASGDVGVGRLADPGRIVEAVAASASRRDLEGLRVLVTAGPTREPLDPVRFISNRSSGRMGHAVAAEARRRGAHVVLVNGPTALEPPTADELVRVETAQAMAEECLARFDDVDVVVKAAAVSDWRPAQTSPKKRKKHEADRNVVLEPTLDIASELGRKKGDQVLVLFAAETEDEVRYASDKLRRKNADLVVANLVGRPGTGFDSETNQAAFVSPDGVEELGTLTKDELAERIWDRVRSILPAGKKRTVPGR